MKKKRLLFFANSLYGGGAEKVLQTLLINLDSYKYDITLYSVNEDVLNNKYPSNIKYKYIFKQHANNIISRLWAKIANKIKLIIYYNLSPVWFYRLFVRGEYDTEIAFIEGYSTRIISGSTNKHSRKIAWMHTDLKNNHWTKIAFRNDKEEAKVYSKFNNIVCVSNSVKDIMIELFESGDYITIYNPIDDKTIQKLSKSVPKLKGLNDTIKLISIGRLVSEKGYDRLLLIVKQLISEGIKVSLTILGEGGDRQQLEEYIKSNNLANHVFLPGFIDNPYAIMAQHDIFVCSSRAEGYSLVIAEAMILELPIISTNCSGPVELLENGKYGIITENCDDALYKGIKSMITDINLYNTYKSKAIARGKDFSLSKQISEIENIL